MKIQRAEKLTVTCSRKGTYKAKALRDFDTLKDEWYPVVVDQVEPVRGMSMDWHSGEEIPCRRGHAIVKRRK